MTTQHNFNGPSKPPAPLHGELLAAVRRRDISLVKSLLAQGASLAEKDYNGDTPLNIAAFHGHTDIARLLIEKGAVIDDRNNNGNTALIWAATFGHTEIARLLLDKCADPAIVNYFGNNAMEAAKKTGRTEIIKLLTEHEKLLQQTIREKEKADIAEKERLMRADAAKRLENLHRHRPDKNKILKRPPPKRK